MRMELAGPRCDLFEPDRGNIFQEPELFISRAWGAYIDSGGNRTRSRNSIFVLLWGYGDLDFGWGFRMLDHR